MGATAHLLRQNLTKEDGKVNLVELREAVVKQIGRTDLVGFTLGIDGIRIPDYETERGVDRFINSAVKTLSNEIKIQDNLLHFSDTVDATHAGIIVPGLLQVEKHGASLDGKLIDWCRQTDIRGYYDTLTNHTGTPVWWFRLTRNGAFLPPYSYLSGLVTKYYEIGVYPIPEKAYVFTVSAWTYMPLRPQGEEEGETGYGWDENWWSENEPKAIIDLACAEINAVELNGDRRVIDATLERVKFNLLAKDILEEEVHMGNTIA